jgi:hypothetical protein
MSQLDLALRHFPEHAQLLYPFFSFCSYVSKPVRHQIPDDDRDGPRNVGSVRTSDVADSPPEKISSNLHALEAQEHVLQHAIATPAIWSRFLSVVLSTAVKRIILMF